MSYATIFWQGMQTRTYGIPFLTSWKSAFQDKSALYRVLFLLLLFPAIFPLLSIINIIVGPLVVAFSVFELMRAMLFEGIVLVALLLYIALVLRGSKYKPFFTRTHLYIFGLGVLLFITAAFSQDLRASIFSSSSRADGLFFLFHVGIYILLLSWIVRERKELEFAFILIVTAGFASAVGAFVLYFWQNHNNPAIVIRQSIEIILGNTGFFAHYLIFIFFTNLYFIIVRPRVWNVAVLVAVTLAVFYTFSSTALSIVAIVCGVLLFILARPWFYGFLTFGFFAWWYGITFGDAFLARIANPFIEEFTRGVVWKDAIELVTKYNPIHGFGWGNAEIMWNLLEHDSWAASGTPWVPHYFDKIHNIVFEFFVAGGILVVTALLLFWTRIMGRAVKLMRGSDKTGLFLTAAFAAHLFYLQFNFDTVMSYSMGSVWLVSFLIFTQEKSVTWPRVGWSGSFKWTSVGLLCIAILTTLWYLNLRPLSVFFQATQVQGDAGRVPTTPHDLDLKRAQFARARDLVGLNKSILNEVGIALRTVASHIEPQGELLADYVREIRFNSDALISAHPLNPFYYYRRAQVEQEIAKDLDQSAYYLKQATALAPHKGIFRFQLGIIYLRADKISEARDIFLELQRMEWNVGAMDLYLAIADFLEGKMHEGRKKFLASLATYTPTAEIEWDMLTGSYLVHGNPEDLLILYQRIRKMIGPHARLNEIITILEDMLAHQAAKNGE